jgi:alginate O-acetyltransferase complex protein AlgI
MVFSSAAFLFYFLPLVFLLYRFTSPRLKNVLLLFSSLFFYFWGEQWLVAMLLASIAANYMLALIMANSNVFAECKPLEVGGKRNLRQKSALGAALVINLGLLATYKYSNFFVVDVFGEAFGANASFFTNWQEIALPLGISFYTFQALSYVLDVYSGVVPATRNFVNLACYITMFPQLVAGPIVRYSDIMAQLVRRTISVDDFAEGARRFILGLGKKVIIADSMGQVADGIFSMPVENVPASHAWLAIGAYTLQIYFDFSGYSDMAIGLGRMFGFHFLENFNYPYISRNITEFWRRWHISLSTWFRDYLYIPLGGNRVGRLRNLSNLWFVFLLCGLWHGASWTFVIWGAYHGLFLVAEKAWLGNAIRRLPVVLQHSYAMLVVMIGWVIFRADNMGHAGGMLLSAFGFGATNSSVYSISYYLNGWALVTMVAGVVFCTPVSSVVGRYFSGRTGSFIKFSMLAGVLGISTIRIVADSFHPFLYFRF